MPARTSPGYTRSASPVERPGQGRKVGDWKKYEDRRWNNATKKEDENRNMEHKKHVTTREGTKPGKGVGKIESGDMWHNRGTMEWQGTLRHVRRTYDYLFRKGVTGSQRGGSMDTRRRKMAVIGYETVSSRILVIRLKVKS